jgi:hypothetical protein
VYIEHRRIAKLPTTQVLELLKSLPERHASDLLDILRRMGDPAAALAVFNDSMGGGARQQKAHGTHAVTYSQITLESELMVKNPVAYPSLHPLEASKLAKSLLLQPSREGVSSIEDHRYVLPYEIVIMASVDFGQPLLSLNPTDYPETQTGTSGMNPAETLPVDADSAIRRFRSTASPDKRAKEISYCDDRLHDLNISYWTDIDVSNDFAAQVISLYLQTDHPILGLFDPYLFIGDLIAMRDRFCSRLLVHSLMYLGCVSPKAPLTA